MRPPDTRPRAALARSALLAATATVAAVIAALAFASPGSTDFVAQYAAARLVATGRGSETLDPSAVLAVEHEAVPARTALLPFVQPPAVALLLAPLGALPFAVAYPAMVLVDAALLVAAVALLARAIRPARAAAVFALLAPPAAIALGQGQTSPLVLLLVALSLGSRPAVAGVALGLTLLRPQTAPLLLLAGLADRPRALATAIGAASVVLASLAVVGADGLATYAARLLDAGTWSVTGSYGLRSSVGWPGLALWLGMPELGAVLVGASAVAGAVATLTGSAAIRPATAAAWAVLASPHVLMHDAVLLYPALLDRSRSGAAALAWSWSALVAWVAHLTIGPLASLCSLGVALAAIRPGHGLPPRRPPPPG